MQLAWRNRQEQGYKQAKEAILREVDTPAQLAALAEVESIASELGLSPEATLPQGTYGGVLSEGSG